MVVADLIVDLLEEAGYTVTDPCVTFDEAVEMLQTEAPDLVLLDINLIGDKDGIQVAEVINQTLGIPFIFLTANSDRATLERAKTVNPSAFLVKPFKPVDLVNAIELAMHTHNTRPVKPQAPKKPLKELFVKHGNSYHKITLEEITYVQSELNYVEIHTLDGRKFVHRATLTELSERLPEGFLLRTHRSYMVRVANITEMAPDYVKVGEAKVPVSKKYRAEVREAIELL